MNALSRTAARSTLVLTTLASIYSCEFSADEVPKASSSATDSGAGGVDGEGRSGSGADGGGGSPDGGECRDGLTDCGGVCADIDRDPEHCGECGSACPPDRLCRNGVCSCPEGLSACDDGCVNFDNDVRNCGACNVACLPGEVCSRGACALECGDGLTRCEERCFDTESDPEHCGGCAGRCEFENAEAACLGGRCIAAECNEGFANADGLDANGCECSIEDEVCNGVDDDCDQRIDEDESDGPNGSRCLCGEERYEFYPHPQMYQDQPATGSQRCADTNCTRLPDGSVLMEYCLLECAGPEEWPYALCEFAKGDLQQFDAYWSDDESDIEVRFCIEGGSVGGELNLWYGKHQYRRRVPLIAKNSVLPPDCYVRHFAPEQVRTPDFSAIEPQRCRNQCGKNVGPATSTVDAGTDAGGAGAGSDDGGAGAGGDGGTVDCRFSLNQPEDGGPPPLTPIIMAAENCNGRTEGRIRILSVRRLDANCRCGGSADCHDPARPICQSALQTPDCPRSTSLGVCRPERLDTPEQNAPASHAVP